MKTDRKDQASVISGKDPVSGGAWRFSFLTEALVRCEWSDSGVFEDRPTQVVVNRGFGSPVPIRLTHQRGSDGQDWLVLDTSRLHLVYDGRPFSPQGLSLVVGGTGSLSNTWHFGDDKDPAASGGNLGGTARTLDGADGPVPLGQGLLSRDGWAVLDDSSSGIPTPDGLMVKPREEEETDFYFFGYGHDYTEALRDFYRLTGPVPLLPRFALGNWWSRFYPYQQKEYLALMDRFKAEGIPFTVSVIDMDWHRVWDVDPRFGSGWTGYSWNKKLFPDHQRFLSDLHDRGLKVTLNVHPRDGIRAFEDDYPVMARAMGVDPATEVPLDFDLTNPVFVTNYFALHHRMEAEGVDFWWLDWQQGSVARQKGLDPLWLLNHLHYRDSGRDGRWPLTFSRYAGPGSHRYPIGFSGDTVISWDSLKFQPYFTATASNIGYGWWSHDIGGHMLGVRDDELEARWYQFGAFSPINRLHSSASPFAGKEPWNFPAGIRQSMVESLRLRHRLLPYLYSMNYRSHEEGRPLVEPVYWDYPDNGEAYENQDEYLFGDQLIVSPIVTHTDPHSLMASADVWLPRGLWFDFFTGRPYRAACDPSGSPVPGGAPGRSFTAHRPLEGMPVFAPAGGLIPLQDLHEGEDCNDLANPTALTLLAFPGADGSFTLREDAGRLGEQGEPLGQTKTVIREEWEGHRGDGSPVIVIGPAQACDGFDEGGAPLPLRRSWTIRMPGLARPDWLQEGVTVRVTEDAGNAEKEKEMTVPASYRADKLQLTLALPELAVGARIEVILPGAVHLADNPLRPDCREILARAQMPYTAKDKAWEAINREGAGVITTLRTIDGLPDSLVAALEEVILRTTC